MDFWCPLGMCDPSHNSLREILADPDLQQKMGVASRQRVVQSYTWSVMAEQYLDTHSRNFGTRIDVWYLWYCPTSIKPQLKPHTLQAMNAAITHRGPDSDGFYHVPGVGLGMRRLAIIDLNTGDQPIPNEDEEPVDRLQRGNLQFPPTTQGTGTTWPSISNTG